MKKLLFCFLVLVMSMTFIACGSDEDDNKDKPTPTEVVTTPKATPEATPEVTPEATPEPTAVPTEALEGGNAQDASGSDDVNVTPEVTPEADPEPTDIVQNPDIVKHYGTAISEEELRGTWVVDTDALYELYVKMMLSPYEEGSAEYDAMLNFIEENQAAIDEEVASVYGVSMAFEDGIAYLTGNGETEEGLYEFIEAGIGVYDAEGNYQTIVYDASINRLVLSEIAQGIDILFYKSSDEVKYTGAGEDTDVNPENPVIDENNLYNPDYSELTGDPVNSIAEVAGNWIVDKKSLIEMFKAMFVAEEAENYSQEELEQLLAEGGMLDQLFSEAMITMFISEEESYMIASGSVAGSSDEERLQNIYPVPAEFGLILYNADDLEDVTIPAIYNAAEDSLTVMDNEMGIKFFRE